MLKVFLVSFLILGAYSIQINYKDTDVDTIRKYTYDIYDEYFVDIGLSDPIYNSQTLFLRKNGWNGINIDPNPNTIKKFNLIFPQQVNLNYALTQSSQIFAYKSKNNQKNKVLQPTVRLRMNQICDRFFQRRPIFFNIGVEQWVYEILQFNDWENPLCRPSLIQIKQNINQYQQYKNQGHILEKNNYQLLDKSGQNNLIFVAKQVAAQFIHKKQQGIKNQANRIHVTFKSVIKNLQKELKINITRSETMQSRYDPKNQIFYYQFMNRRPIFLDSVIKRSDFFVLDEKMRNKIIVVFNHNPNENAIIISNSNYQLSKFNTAQTNEKFYKLQYQDRNRKNIVAYIFDHRYQPQTQPWIIVEQKSQSNFVEYAFIIIGISLFIFLVGLRIQVQNKKQGENLSFKIKNKLGIISQ